MNNLFDNENVKKAKRRALIPLIVGIIIIIFGIVAIIDAAVNPKYKPVYFDDLMSDNSHKEDEKVYIDVEYITPAFAVYDDMTDAFYFARDNQGYFYILFLKESTYKKIYKNNNSESTYRLTGKSKLISTNVKQLAMEQWNESLPEDKKEDYELTYSNFNDMFGYLYLDQVHTGDSDYVFGIFILIVGLIPFTVGLLAYLRIDKCIKSLSEEERNKILTDINDPNTYYSKSNAIYLTKEYLIILKNTFKCVKYTDILWMHYKDYRYNGIKTGQSLVIYINDGYKHELAQAGIANKNANADLDKISQTIVEKNPNIDLGFDYSKLNYYTKLLKDIRKQTKLRNKQ